MAKYEEYRLILQENIKKSHADYQCEASKLKEEKANLE